MFIVGDCCSRNSSMIKLEKMCCGLVAQSELRVLLCEGHDYLWRDGQAQFFRPAIGRPMDEPDLHVLPLLSPGEHWKGDQM